MRFGSALSEPGHEICEVIFSYRSEDVIPETGKINTLGISDNSFYVIRLSSDQKGSREKTIFQNFFRK